MLDTRRTPDICTLGNLCRRYLDIAEMLEDYACNVTLPNHETEPDAWKDADRMCSAVITLTDALREVSAVASALDGYADPADYGFPPAPIQKPDSADGSYLAGYADGLKAADDTDGKGYTLEDGESLADFARRVQNLTAEQLDDLTADEKKESATDRLAAILNGFKIDAQFMGAPDEKIIHMIHGAQWVEQEMEKKAKRILEALDAEQPTPDDRKDGARDE